MTEPSSVGAVASVTGGMVVLLGPVLGPWAAVVITATIGALWSVGRVETETRLEAVRFLIQIVLTAVVLTGGIAAVLAQKLAWALDHALPAVAFTIGALGDKFNTLKDAVVKRLRSVISGTKE